MSQYCSGFDCWFESCRHNYVKNNPDLNQIQLLTLAWKEWVSIEPAMKLFYNYCASLSRAEWAKKEKRKRKARNMKRLHCFS
jgi:hypothetical protein